MQHDTIEYHSKSIKKQITVHFPRPIIINHVYFISE